MNSFIGLIIVLAVFVVLSIVYGIRNKRVLEPLLLLGAGFF
ncbi:hypothetical protein [Eubacterium oxidoreducens]|uniref:Uncharacterized protein n=1 Tax=Eubacterium oxidoreducens TaxID=1732 RepID=A0A1G6C4W2_EUBOX|nr:hypothetical protein [Eubacterium oxidoreducens]SDB27910.1 hypothetical protein SAMN02910417_02097 [Eubacterium oxidoreducens]